MSLKTSSPLVFPLLHHWFETCFKQHSLCAKSAPAWTPTRLIDLGDPPSSNWKLHIPAEDDINISGYTTMSYRWGGGSFLKLTSHSFASFRSGLPVSGLPRAFQDAISISKTLGFRFIWIDALCIFQDVEQDFHAECTQMSDIYTNSSCNIVATFGQNPHSSIFHTRNFNALQISKVRITENTSGSASELWTEFDTLVDEHCMRREMYSCEASSRGWILQELLLAPRLLCFGRNQVHWLCQDLEACEI